MDTKQFRRELHRHPELSFEEHRTAAFISEQLAALGIEHRPIATTGVLARIEGRRGNLKRCVVLRADIDALPIAEKTGVEWASVVDGVMHGCGHDCHAAVLFGVLKRLNENPILRVHCLACSSLGRSVTQAVRSSCWRRTPSRSMMWRLLLASTSMPIWRWVR